MVNAKPRFFLASLDNSGFRWLLLILVAATVIPMFALTMIVIPLTHQSVPGDLAVYLKAASMIHTGADPYASWLSDHSLDPTRRNGYIYPPLVAWLLSPVSTAPPISVVAGLFVADLAALIAFLWFTARALNFRGSQATLMLLVATLAFFPVQENFKWGQVNLLILAMCSLWVVGWVDGRDVIGGVSLGLSIAVKLLQAPVLLLLVLTRRFKMLTASALAVAATLLVASPGLLPEYFTRVLPQLNVSTGYMANLAPIAFFARLIQPASVFANAQEVPLLARIGAVLLSVMAVLISAIAILRSHQATTSRSLSCLQAASVLSLCPLVSTIDWPAQMALALIPMAVLLEWSLQRRQHGFAIAVLVTWLLLGPLQQVLWTAADNPAALGGFAYPVFWLLSQSASAAIFLLWGATTLALRVETMQRLPGSARPIQCSFASGCGTHGAVGGGGIEGGSGEPGATSAG